MTKTIEYPFVADTYWLILSRSLNFLAQLNNPIEPILSMEDEFIYLEDLKDERTVQFIKEENERTKLLLGKRADELYPKLLEILYEPRVLQLFAFDENTPVMLVYGKKRSVNLGRKELYTAQSDEVIQYIWKIRGFRELGISVGKKGSDEVRTFILSEEGRIIRDLGNWVSQPFYHGNEVCYVKSYRTSPPPDGGEYPTYRVFCGDDIVYGKELKPGEFISIDVFGDVITLVKTKGWRYSELYVGESFDKLRKVDEAELIDVVDYKDYIIYRKNDNVILNGVTLGFEKPINAVASGKDFIAVSLIKDYRTPVEYYDLSGKKIGEEPHDNVIMMDGGGSSLFLLETSFSFISKVTRRRIEGGVLTNSETIIETGKYEVGVKDIYVKGDVLLHGFLLYKHEKSKGVIVYGYGGFRISLLPFSPYHLKVLLEDGYSFLVTNLRGGYENGEEWHKAGMLLNKKNVFRDFEHFLSLVKLAGGRTVAMGGSNGGLLVGAVLNETPQLVDCAVIGHPVLDMMRYHKMYVGKYWIEEYGDPDDPEFKDYLLSYSPYHNLKGGLPKTFVYTGINDDRVHPAHALKYVAKARKLGNDVLLFVNDSGHSLTDPETLAKEYSYVTAFIEECLK